MEQREFKFRYVWQHEDTGTISVPIFSLYRIAAEGLSGVDRHVLVSVDQYTGLKDVNGKEIYENDFVDWDDASYKITWSEEFGWMMKDDRDDWECPSLYSRRYVDVKKNDRANVELLGNIYENPYFVEKMSTNK